MIALLLLPLAAHAGSYVWVTRDAAGNVTGHSPTYSGGQTITVPAPAPPASSPSPYSTGYSNDIPFYGGSGFAIQSAKASSVTCQGAITPTFTWRPAPGQTMTTDPPPASAVVEQYCSVSSGLAANAVGTWSTGLGQSGTGQVPDYRQRGADTTYMVKSNPGPSFSLPSACSPSVVTSIPAGNFHALISSGVTYTAKASPVTIDIYGGATPTATKHFLIGQSVYGFLNKSNLPNLSTDSYSWSVSGGKPFDNYAAFNDHAKYFPLFSSQPSTGFSMTCYFAKPETATFTCSATVMGLPVTVTRDVVLVKPSTQLAVQIGTVDDLPDSTNPIGVELRRLNKTDTFPIGNAYGTTWTGNVLTPVLYDGYQDVGQWNWTQLVTSNQQELAGSQWLKIALRTPAETYKSIYGVQGLDTYYPYGTFWYQADGTDNGSADSPYVPFSDPYNLVSDVSVNDSFQDYLMYLPPGSSSRVVPLKEADWFWSAHATKSAGVWATSNKNAQWGFGNDFPDHPVWTWAMPADTTQITYAP